MFSKETYMGRRAKLKQTIGSGLLLFLGNDESGMNYADNTSARIPRSCISSGFLMPVCPPLLILTMIKKSFSVTN